MSIADVANNAYPISGHTRPLLSFTARLVKLNSTLSVTILLTNEHFDRAVKELARSIEVGDEDTSKRIRSVTAVLIMRSFGTDCSTECYPLEPSSLSDLIARDPSRTHGRLSWPRMSWCAHRRVCVSPACRSPARS